MTDGQRLLCSVAAGAAAFVVITALYYLEGREPNNALVASAGVMGGIGLWYFLDPKRKS
jgi:hypothetical protein